MTGLFRKDERDRKISVVNNAREKQFTVSSLLFITGGVILICSLLFAGYIVFSYFMAYNKLTSLGLLLGSLTALGGVFLSCTAFGICRIIEQNREIMERLKDRDFE